MNNRLRFEQPQVMGILNLSPGSFSAVGRYPVLEQAVAYAEKMVEEGAAIIDIGAEPTNPGLHPCLSLTEELDRLLPVVERLVKTLPVPLSIDTSKPEIMQAMAKLGVAMINDVRALREERALAVVAAAKLKVCLMHMAFPQGAPWPGAKIATPDLIATIKDFLQERINACLAAGIAQQDIILDPGIGHGSFGKDLAQNLLLLKHLHEFSSLGCPILIGVSRKTFIGEVLGVPVAERLPGSLAATVFAVLNGATIVRAHDVKATVQALRIVKAIQTEAAG